MNLFSAIRENTSKMHTWEYGCGILNKEGLSHVIPGRELGLSWSPVRWNERTKWKWVRWAVRGADPDVVLLNDTELGCSLFPAGLGAFPGCGWRSECFSQALGHFWRPSQRQAVCVWQVNPDWCGAVELEYSFLSKLHSCFMDQQQPQHMALTCVGFCTVSKKRKRTPQTGLFPVVKKSSLPCH